MVRTSEIAGGREKKSRLVRRCRHSSYSSQFFFHPCFPSSSPYELIAVNTLAQLWNHHILIDRPVLSVSYLLQLMLFASVWCLIPVIAVIGGFDTNVANGHFPLYCFKMDFFFPQGGKFNIVPLLVNIGSGLALLGIVSWLGCFCIELIGLDHASLDHKWVKGISF